MFINNLKIKNFKSVKEISLENLSNERVVCITGENGQGKSSIITAIQYIFTGSMDGKLSDYIRRGKSSFEIYCDFSFKNESYSMKVEHDGKTTEKELTTPRGEVYHNSEASDFINKLIEGDTFNYSAISLQGETYNLLFQKPTERLESIKRIFNVSVLDEKVNELSEKEKSLKERNKVLTQAIDLNQKQDFKYLDTQYFEFTEKEINENISTLEKAQEAYQKELEQIKETETLVKLYEQEKKQIEAFEKEFGEIEKYKKELYLLGENISIRELQSKIYDFEEHTEKVKDRKRNIENSIKDSKNSLALSKEGKCDHCKQDYKLEKSHIEKLEKDLKKFEEYLVIDTKELLDSVNKLKEIKDELNMAQEVKQKRSLLESKIEGIKNKGLDKKILEFKSKKVPEVKNPLLKDVSTDLRTWQKRLTEFEKTKEYNEKIEESNKETREKEKELKKQVEKDTLEVENNTKEINLLKQAKKALGKDFTSYLITKGTEYIKSQMDAFFNDVYGGRYKVTYDNSGGTINFYFETENQAPRSVLLASGFEKALLGIAFRISLVEMKKYGFMVLDEIDSFADSSKSESLFESILKYENLEQVFIITHNESTKEYLENEGAVIFEVSDGCLL